MKRHAINLLILLLVCLSALTVYARDMIAQGGQQSEQEVLKKVEAYFQKQRARGQAMACLANLKNIGVALDMWACDHGGVYPESLSLLAPKYLSAVPTCLAARKDTYSSWYRTSSSRKAVAVYCLGRNHESAGLGPNLPCYTSEKGASPVKIPEVVCNDPDVLNHPLVKQIEEMKSKAGVNSEMSDIVTCRTYLKNIGTSLEMWAMDHGGCFPESLSQLVPKYLRYMYQCPAAEKDTYSSTYRPDNSRHCYSFCCGGHNHKTLGPNFPAFDSANGCRDK